MLGIVKQRIINPSRKNKLVMYSDGNDDYTYILAELFKTQHVRYGQVIKIRENGRVVYKIKRGIYGKPRHRKIETINVENFNSILRERVGRLVRKTKCFAKRRKWLDRAITLFGFHWNFMKPLRDKKTPAMLEGLTEDSWYWDKFFNAKLSYVR